MTTALSVTAAATDGLEAAVPSCVTTDSSSLCARLYDWFGLDWLAANAETLVGVPLRILLVVAVALVARAAINRTIRRLTDRTATGQVPTILKPRRTKGGPSHQQLVEQVAARRTQRAEAVGSVLRSFSSIVVFFIAVVLVLGELGINLAPIVASAGVVGVALGFGAQNLIKDFIAGIGIILEDQYGVGDVVDLGEASGTVEAVGLRITRLRDINGVVWYARNGEVLRVGNKSQGFAQVVIDIPVAHDTDLERCRALIQHVGDAVYAEPEWAEVILDDPQSLGVESITPAGILMRLQVRTTNADQWRVARELRQRLQERFATEGIKIPLPTLVGAVPGGSR